MAAHHSWDGLTSKNIETWTAGNCEIITAGGFEESCPVAEGFRLGLVVQDNVAELRVLGQQRRAPRKLV
jgi:hypothetical protein